MITREEIVWLYRCVLGREPESENAILGHLHVHVDLLSARRALMRSAEFDSFYRNTVANNVNYRRSDPKPFERSQRSMALAAIVRNEESYIEGMINSCADLVCFVAIVDSRSDDSTVSKSQSLLQRLGIDHVVETVEFTNFSDARNAALDLVPENVDWTLMLDADERIEKEDFWRFKDLLDSDEFDVWSLPRFNFVDNEKVLPPAHYPDRQARLIRNLPNSELRFSGLVHESIRNARCMGHAPESEPGDYGKIGGPHIHHIGLTDQPAARVLYKTDLYHRLMLAGDE